MSYQEALAEQRRVRAHQQRQEGVEYKLRVIEGSGGLLELVEHQLRRGWCSTNSNKPPDPSITRSLYSTPSWRCR